MEEGDGRHAGEWKGNSMGTVRREGGRKACRRTVGMEGEGKGIAGEQWEGNWKGMVGGGRRKACRRTVGMKGEGKGIVS